MEFVILGLLMLIAIGIGAILLQFFVIGLLAYVGYSVGGPCGAVTGALIGIGIMGGGSRGRGSRRRIRR